MDSVEEAQRRGMVSGEIPEQAYNKPHETPRPAFRLIDAVDYCLRDSAYFQREEETLP